MEMIMKLYRQASNLEEADPDKALKIYDKLARENLEFHRGVLLLATIGFIIGFLIAFFVGQSVGIGKQSIVLPLIWYGAGLTIALLSWAPKAMPEMRDRHLLWVPVMAAGLAFAKLFEVCILPIVTILLAAPLLFAFLGIASYIHYIISGAPFVWFTASNLPPSIYVIYLPVAALFLAVAFLILVEFDVSAPATISMKVVLRVINLKKRESLFNLFLFVTVLSIVFGWYPDNVFYNNIIVGIILSVVAGTLTGFAFAPIERDNLLANLYRIAKARCLIHMNCEFEANFPLKDVYEDRDSYRRSIHAANLENLQIAVSLICEKRELKQRKTLFQLTRHGIYFRPHRVSDEDIMAYLNDLREPSTGDEYGGIVSDNIEKTKNLVSLS